MWRVSYLSHNLSSVTTLKTVLTMCLGEYEAVKEVREY